MTRSLRRHLAEVAAVGAAVMLLLSYDMLSDVTTSIMSSSTSSSGLRRRASVALDDGQCKLTEPVQAPKNIQPTFAASYPGSGASLTYHLVEALTGLFTGDDRNQNKRNPHIVTLKTHYPHAAGRAVPWSDQRIQRAIVLLRNPKDAISAFYNHVHEFKNSLDPYSTHAPNDDAWREWRDNNLDLHLHEYEKFVEYWMDKYVNANGAEDAEDAKRLIVTYERLVSDEMGPSEALKLSLFLDKADGVTSIEEKAVPCIWERVVKYWKYPSEQEDAAEDVKGELEAEMAKAEAAETKVVEATAEAVTAAEEMSHHDAPQQVGSAVASSSSSAYPLPHRRTSSNAAEVEGLTSLEAPSSTTDGAAAHGAIAAAATPAVPPPPPAADAGEWKPFVDPASGQTYYYNEKTGVSSWTNPAAAAATPPGPPVPPNLSAEAAASAGPGNMWQPQPGGQPQEQNRRQLKLLGNLDTMRGSPGDDSKNADEKAYTSDQLKRFNQMLARLLQKYRGQADLVKVMKDYMDMVGKTTPGK